jgi:hypothetical protein
MLPRLACPRIDASLLPAGAWRTRAGTLRLVDALSGAAPAEGTLLRAAWSEAEWHLHFECADTLPWATLGGRDAALWTEEVVEVFIDPVGDGAGYFEIEVNPLGAVCDLVLRRIASGWRKDFSWQVEGLRASAGSQAGGWWAELAIPFAALTPVRPRPGTVWRANFFRIDRPGGVAGSTADRVLSAWSPTGWANFHVPEKFGYIDFLP